MPSRSLDVYLKDLQEDVTVFYKGFSLTIARPILQASMLRLKEHGFQKEIPTAALVRQMDDFCERIGKSYTDKADLNDDATFQKYFPSGDMPKVQHLSIIWAMNVATLLHRKVIKNDEYNGWLAFNVIKPTA